MLARLARIEALDGAGAPPDALLGEVRALLEEAEAWVRAEPAGSRLAETALERCRAALSAETRRATGLAPSRPTARARPAVGR